MLEASLEEFKKIVIRLKAQKAVLETSINSISADNKCLRQQLDAFIQEREAQTKANEGSLPRRHEFSLGDPRDFAMASEGTLSPRRSGLCSSPH